MEEYVRSTETTQLKMLEKVRKKVRIGALKYRTVLESEEQPPFEPFEAMNLGTDFFLKTWLKESEFQR